MQPPSGFCPIEHYRSANKGACLSGDWGGRWQALDGEILSCMTSFLPPSGEAPQGWGHLPGLGTQRLGSQPSVQRTLLLTPGPSHLPGTGNTRGLCSGGRLTGKPLHFQGLGATVLAWLPGRNWEELVRSVPIALHRIAHVGLLGALTVTGPHTAGPGGHPSSRPQAQLSIGWTLECLLLSLKSDLKFLVCLRNAA